MPSAATERLGEAARAAQAYLAIGVIERDAVSGGTRYCTLLYFGPDDAEQTNQALAWEEVRVEASFLQGYGEDLTWPENG